MHKPATAWCQTAAKTNTKDQQPQGQWRIRQYPYLELQADADPNWFYYLEISQTQSVDQISTVNEIRLTPLQSYQAFAGCFFEYGVRQNSPAS